MEIQIPFIFQRSPKIIFGIGKIAKIGTLAATFGKNILLIRGRSLLHNSSYWSLIVESLKENRIEWSDVEIYGEPSPEMIDNTVDLHSSPIPDCVIAIGGGSVIDAGKAIAAMLPGKGNVAEFLEVVGTRKPDGRKIPLIAVPTTAGTGSEATANAVISRIGENGFKRSLRHENYIPDIALVDPTLALSCPATVTAACGMDALTQLLEAYVSIKASLFTDALCESALPLAGMYLVNAVHHGTTDIDARSGMAYASLVSGVALANAGLGVVHGLASLIGALFPVPHGVVCGTLLAGSVKATINKLTLKEPGSLPLKKYAHAASLLMGQSFSNEITAHTILCDYLYELTGELSIPKLSEYGITEKDIDRFIIENVNKNNPVHLTNEEIRTILLERT
jgi:alcohol dehydrogenase class IV